MEIGHNGSPRRGLDYHIAPVIVGIVEALLPGLGHYATPSGLARKIGGPIASEDQTEKLVFMKVPLSSTTETGDVIGWSAELIFRSSAAPSRGVHLMDMVLRLREEFHLQDIVLE
jgi:hypothetical protein